MVGNAHVGVFRIIKEIQKEQHQVKLNIESILRGIPKSLPKKREHEHENQIQTVYNDRNNRSLIEYL